MRTRPCALLLTALLAGIVSGVAASPAVASPPPPGLHLLRAGPTGLTLEWTAPPVRVQALGDGTTEVTAEGCAQTRQPGMPRLPFTSILIALPPGATPRLRILSAEGTTQHLPAPVAPAPRPEGVVRDSWGRPIGGSFAPAGAENRTAARVPVVLEEIGVARGVRLARLAFYPALPKGGTLRVIQRLRVEVSWDAPHPSPPPRGEGAPTSPLWGGLRGGGYDPLLERLRRAVLNPWDVIPAPRPSGREVLRSTGGGALTAFLEVAHSGLYRVTYEDLESLGFGGTDPPNLRLFRGSDEVAYEWEGDADPAFEPGEALLFYAEPRFSRWTIVDAYRLVADATPGQRMATRSADPAGLPSGTPWVERLAEENHIYTPDCFCGPLPPGHDGDRWAWELLRRPDLATASFSIQTLAADAGQPAELSLWFIGYTDVSADPDHRVDVALNGTSLGRVEWDGKTAFTVTLPVSAGILSSGTNSLTLSLPGILGVFPEGAWLDAFAVRYARSAAAAGTSLRFVGEAGRRAYTIGLADTSALHAYDVTDPLRPQKLTDVQVDGNTVALGDPPEGGPRHYLATAASAVRSPARVRPLSTLEEPAGADVLVVSPADLTPALSPLVDLRQFQGLSVFVADVQAVYDTGGDGRPDPEVIHAFIAHAYAAWDPRPTYLLLVGDGSFDPRGYRPESPPTLIPSYLADVDPWAGETAADNRYACVDGDDTLPDLSLGRLPVETVEEAQAVVDKIVRYETSPLPGGWNANVVLVADDADRGGNFIASSEAYAAAHVTAPFTVTRRYCVGTSPYSSDCPAQETDALHTALLGDWNQGALLAEFTGHASWQQWAAERFFHLDDLAVLYNSHRLPVVVEMTCFTGAFQRPEPTLDEDLVALPGGGAVAAWGPTGLGVGTGHGHLSDGFFRAVFEEEVGTVGEATLAGKLALAVGGQNLDLLDTFNLLGDPALRLNRTIVPWTEQVFLPLVGRSFPRAGQVFLPLVVRNASTR